MEFYSGATPVEIKGYEWTQNTLGFITLSKMKILPISEKYELWVTDTTYIA